jgi:protein-S-isoprenylcysteine O-methyltransferase Ste14
LSLRKLRTHLLRVAFVPIVFVAILVRPGWPTESPAAFVVELVGYLFLVGGLVMRIWCTLYIGSRKSKELIVEGPYSICRNPLYVGSFLLAIGAGFCFENVLMVLFVPAIVIPVHIIVTRMEEAHLESAFGGQYLAYKEKVPRFWPRLRGYSSADTVKINIRSIRRIVTDTVAVLLLPQVEDLLELLHEQGVIPVLWHFPS